MVEENKDKVVNEEDKIGNKDKKMNNAMREDCQMLQSERGEGGVEMGMKKGVREEDLEEREPGTEAEQPDLPLQLILHFCEPFLIDIRDPLFPSLIQVAHVLVKDGLTGLH